MAYTVEGPWWTVLPAYRVGHVAGADRQLVDLAPGRLPTDAPAILRFRPPTGVSAATFPTGVSAATFPTGPAERARHDTTTDRRPSAGTRFPAQVRAAGPVRVSADAHHRRSLVLPHADDRHRAAQRRLLGARRAPVHQRPGALRRGRRRGHLPGPAGRTTPGRSAKRGDEAPCPPLTPCPT